MAKGMLRNAVGSAVANVSPMDGRHLNLVLMRHGKSTYPIGVADHDRPLAPRGRREAALGGDWLRANLPTVDAVLCSTAIRARDTLGCTGIDTGIRYVARLYGATPGAMIEDINQVDDDVTTLLVVGHEPTTSSVALILADPEDSNSAAAESISDKYPTSAIAVLDVPGRWADLEPGSARLTDFHVPR